MWVPFLSNTRSEPQETDSTQFFSGQALKTQGFDPGTPDGLFGPRTRGAISAWQEAQGESEVTGYLEQDDLDALLASCKQATPKHAAPTPLCTGETDTPCWMETANQPGCHIWNPYPAPEETVTWSGACIDGKVSGKGKTVWRFRRDGAWKTSGGEGGTREGRLRYGHWVSFDSDGEVWEGPYVDGKPHGRWVKRGSRGEQWECWNWGERIYVENYSLCASWADSNRMKATAGVSLRSGPSQDYEEIGRLRVDDEVTVTHIGSKWAWVETGSGKQGFVPLSALQEVTQQAIAEPEEPAATKDEEPQVAAVVTKPKCFNESEAYIHIYNCWMRISNFAECAIFMNLLHIVDNNTLNARPDTVTWSDQCADGLAEGKGTLTIYSDEDIGNHDESRHIQLEGEISKGRWHGPTRMNLETVLAVGSGSHAYTEVILMLAEVDFLNGLPHGLITKEVKALGVTSSLEGWFEDGEAHGSWNYRHVGPDGISEATIIYERGKYIHTIDSQ